MTFMRKIMDFLNMDNLEDTHYIGPEQNTYISDDKNTNIISDNKNFLYPKTPTQRVCVESMQSNEESVYETKDHSIVRKYKSNGFTTTCITPPPKVNEPQFISEVKKEELVQNIFFESNIPVVNKCKYVRRIIDILTTRDNLLNIKESTRDFYFYDIDKNSYLEFSNLVYAINKVLSTKRIQDIFYVNVKELKFEDSNTKICKSSIRYDYEKNLFYFFFTNDIERSHSVGTEYGEIAVDENGLIKSAYFIKWLDGTMAKLRFKSYKKGFDLYDLKYNGIIYYKRNSKM